MSIYKLKEYDDLGKDNIVARAGTLKLFGNEIDTPSPIPTSSDIKKLIALKKAVKHLQDLKFTQPITEIIKSYSLKMLKSLEKSPSASERLKNQIEDVCDHVKFSMFRLSIGRDVDFIDILSDTYTEVQIQAQNSLMLIKDRKFNSPINIFDKRIGGTREYIESNHDKQKYCSILPELRMDMPLDLFEQKIRIATDNGFDGIVFIHAPYYTSLKKYRHIQKIAKDTEMWFHLAGCPPVWNGNNKTSLPHFYTSTFGFDTASVMRPRRFFAKPKGQTTLIDKKKIKKHLKFMKFNDNSWGLVEPPEWNKCDYCPVDKDHKDSNSFIKTWHGCGLAIPALNYHNLAVGHREMGIERKFIMQKELLDYLKDKKYMAEAVRSVLKLEIDARQGRLGKWVK